MFVLVYIRSEYYWTKEFNYAPTQLHNPQSILGKNKMKIEFLKTWNQSIGIIKPRWVFDSPSEPGLFESSQFPVTNAKAPQWVRPPSSIWMSVKKLFINQKCIKTIKKMYLLLTCSQWSIVISIITCWFKFTISFWEADLYFISWCILWWTWMEVGVQ